MAGGSAGNGPIAGLQKNEPKIGMQGKTKSSAKNEAQLYSAALRSSLHGGRAGSGVKGRDERQSTAPLTPLPTPAPHFALDLEDIVRDVKPPPRRPSDNDLSNPFSISHLISSKTLKKPARLCTSLTPRGAQ